MRAHLVQMDIAWEDRDANFATVERLLGGAEVERGDLVVLPEMFDTGFSFHIERTADAHGVTEQFLSDLAKRLGVTLHGARTMTTANGERGLNRAHIVGPSGETLAAYDKIHPFSYGREAERFVGGSDVVTYEWRASASGFGQQSGDEASEREGMLRVCPAVCYDLRFPELFRAGLERGAEAFALGANWPSARQAHWRALAIARAIENQAYVFAVNRVGSDPKLSYVGGSLIVSPRGDVVNEGSSGEEVVSGVVEPAAVAAWREEFPAWRDRSAALGSRGS